MRSVFFFLSFLFFLLPVEMGGNGLGKGVFLLLFKAYFKICEGIKWKI